MTQSIDSTHLVASLQPQAVFTHFATLCQIPRPSKGEAALTAHLLQWAHQKGLAARLDGAGNLIIAKPASPGAEHAPGVILQSHLDMVCQKNTASDHDFSSDPIHTQVDDGWLIAPQTTLGADNGIGVAMILAALEDTSLVHGPLEALLTVDEEAGMGGAQGVAAGELNGSLMINLDTEEWGEFYLGCAGGLDVNVTRPGTPQPLDPHAQVWRLSVTGLRGGHSGINIHEGRGNAIRVLVRALQALGHLAPFQLVSLSGGTARNALPREAEAVLAVAADQAATLANWVAGFEQRLRTELAGVDDRLVIQLVPAHATHSLAPHEQQVWLNSLHAAPYGVERMSVKVTGVAETSNNLGVVRLSPAAGEANFMVRSLVDSCAAELGQRLASVFALSQSQVTIDGQYPGWAPNPDSPLLQTCQAVYQHLHGQPAQVQVIHAGLECGILSAKYPGVDIISFGPTIRGAHAPGERVNIHSVSLCWDLFRAILVKCTGAAPVK
jgi:dipeptidase D